MNKIPDSEFSCAESQYFTTEEQDTLEGRRSRSLADRDPRLLLYESATEYTKKTSPDHPKNHHLNERE